MNKKFTSTIAGASIFITFTGLISKGLGFFREVIFASLFGLTSDFDIYLVAAVLPLTINTIILYLAQNYLIPASHIIKENEHPSGNDFIERNFFIFILGGLIFSAVLYFFTGPIIKLYIQQSNLELINKAQNIFRLFLLSIPMTCAISVLIAYLQVHFEFRYPAYSQLLLNLSFIILLLIFSGSFSIYIIPLGYDFGLLLQLLYLIKQAKIRLKIINPLYLLKNYKRFLPVTLLIIILIESIGQLNIVVDRYFYSRVPTGGIAALNYAQTVFLLPLSILSIAISTAIFPRFSQYISGKNMKALENIFNESMKINVAIFIPITIIFFYYGDILIKVIFQRGKFSVNNTMITFETLKYLSVSLVFYSIYSVMNKLLYSLGRLKNLLYITIAGIFIKIILNFFLVVKLEQYGLALSTSFSYLFFFICSLFLIYKSITMSNKSLFIKEMIFHISNGLITLFISKQVKDLLPGITIFLEIFLFVTIYSFNIFLVKHSLNHLIISLKNSLKENWSLSGRSEYE